MALRSGKYDIYALAGETLLIDFDLFEDPDQVTPYPLTGCTVTIVLKPPSLSGATPIVLTAASGLTIDDTAGVVTMTQDTTGWAVGRGRWYMEVVDQYGDVSYPARGIVFVGNP